MPFKERQAELKSQLESSKKKVEVYKCVGVVASIAQTNTSPKPILFFPWT